MSHQEGNRCDAPMMVFLHLSRPRAVMTVLTRSSFAAFVICRGSRSSAAK